MSEHFKFTDLDNKSKHMRTDEDGKIRHTGNANYILTSKNEVIYHPVKKAFNKVMQSLRARRG